MRNIKDVLRGGVEESSVKGIWDITPIVNIDETIPTLLSTDGLVISEVDADTATLALAGVTDQIVLGVARTNIDLSSLSNEDAFQFGIEALSNVATGNLVAVGYFIGSTTLTDAAAKTLIYNIILLGTTPPPGTVVHYTASDTNSFEVNTSVFTTDDGVQFSYSVPGIDLATGSKGGMVLKRGTVADTIHFGTFLEDSTAAFNDLAAETVIDTAGVFINSLRVYVFALSYNLGEPASPHQDVTIKITTTAAPTIYDVTGTSYAAIVGNTQETWDAAFGTVVTPPRSSVTSQAVFPVGAKAGHFYKTYIDPQWGGNTPTPYGITAYNNQSILVTEVALGDERFVAYVDNTLMRAGSELVVPIIDAQLVPLTDEIAAQAVEIAAVVAAQESQATDVLALGTAVEGALNDVELALLNAPEVVVYVRLPANYSDASLNFSTSLTFLTLNDAYNYLITLPKQFKKRMVFDDRVNPLNVYTGVAGVTYLFVDNNITLSTYSEFTNLLDTYTAAVSRVHLTCDCSALLLDKFVGKYSKSATPVPTSSLATPPIAVSMSDRIRLLDRVYLETTDADIALTASRNIVLGDDCILKITLQSDSSLYPVMDIKKGARSYVRVFNTLPTFNPTVSPWLRINSDVSGYNDIFDNLRPNIATYTYFGLDALKLASIGSFGVVRVVRAISDLGTVDANGVVTINDNFSFLFVKSMHLGSGGIRIALSRTATFYALNDGVVISNSGAIPLVENYGVCYDYGLHLVIQDSTKTAILNHKGYHRAGGIIKADRLFESIQTGDGPHEFTITDVDHYAISSYYPSIVGNCTNFQMTNIRLRTPVGIRGYLNFVMPTINAWDYYLVSGLKGVSGVSVNPSPNRGIIDLQGAAVINGDPSDVFNIKDIDIIHTATTSYYPVVTIKSVISTLMAWKKGPLFNYENRRFSAYATESSAASSGTLGNAPKLLNWLKRDGLATVGGDFSHQVKYNSRVPEARFFRVSIKGTILRLAGTPDTAVGQIYVVHGKPSGSATVFNFTVPLPLAATLYPFEASAIVSLNVYDTLALHISLSSSAAHEANSNVEYSIEEL